jgi:uncharacterized membrane protein YhaH (DUF805 family)
MNKFFRRFAQPMDRGQYGGAVLMSLFWAMEVMSISNDRSHSWFWPLIQIMAGLYVLIWPIATAGRLADIGWSRWLVIAFAIPWVFFIGSANWRSKLWSLAALLAMVLAQLPLLLIKGGVFGGAKLGIHVSDEPSA